MASEPDFKSMKGKVDQAGKNFSEDGTGKVWVLYTSAYQAPPKLADLTDYAGHRVRVLYERRESDAAYGCDLSTA